MTNDAIRGNSLRTTSLVSDSGVELEDRQLVSYQCTHCSSVLSIPFSVEAEVPDQWSCTRCGHDAWKEGVTPVVEEEHERVGKTPFEMLLERRSRDELEEILNERLSYLRARRGLDANSSAR